MPARLPLALVSLSVPCVISKDVWPPLRLATLSRIKNVYARPSIIATDITCLLDLQHHFLSQANRKLFVVRDFYRRPRTC
jgi:hypothetical protein